METKKKVIIGGVAAVIVVALALGGLFGITAIVSETANYPVETEFFYSTDGGHSYGNGLKEFAVNENAYMKVIIFAKSPTFYQKKINASLVIPYIQDVDSRYYDGPIITPEIDDYNHTSTYNFSVIAKDSGYETSLVFKFIPLMATEVKITLTFDDRVEDNYDKQNTITFVEQSSGDETE